MAQFLEIRELRGFLPFTRFFHSETTTDMWEDDEGVRHHIRQGEGGEQGDALQHIGGKSRMVHLEQDGSR